MVLCFLPFSFQKRAFVVDHVVGANSAMDSYLRSATPLRQDNEGGLYPFLLYNAPLCILLRGGHISTNNWYAPSQKVKITSQCWCGHPRERAGISLFRDGKERLVKRSGYNLPSDTRVGVIFLGVMGHPKSTWVPPSMSLVLRGVARKKRLGRYLLT